MLMPSGAIGFEKLLDQTGQTGLAANSLMRRSPASEERSPPPKFIFTRLLLSRDVVAKMFIESSF